MKASFLRMMAHWIQVEDNKWKMQAEVVRFKAVSGDHGGRNLGCYFMGLCDRVGICNQNGSKVGVKSETQCDHIDNGYLCTASGNYTQQCLKQHYNIQYRLTVENLHICRQFSWDAAQNQLL